MVRHWRKSNGELNISNQARNKAMNAWGTQTISRQFERLKTSVALKKNFEVFDGRSFRGFIEISFLEVLVKSCDRRDFGILKC